MRHGVRMTNTTTEFREWLLKFVAAELDPATTEIRVTRFSEFILDRCPELNEDPHLSQMVHALARSHWTRFLADVPSAPHETVLIQPAAELAEELARRRIPLKTLYTLYRVAMEATWGFVTEIVDALPDNVERSEFLIFFWSRASEWLNQSVGPSAEVYETERARLQQGSKARRLSLVLDVLGGKALASAQVSAGLDGYPISGIHTALILHTDLDESIATLEAAAQQLGTQIGSRNPLVVSPSDRELWCWYATKSEPDDRGFARCDAWLREQHISAAAGSPGRDVEGFTRSHLEATATRAHVLRTKPRAGMTTYEDVEVLVLLGKDHTAAEAFTRRTLGALAENSEASRRLRHTALAFISLGSADAAAAAMSVHKNTVRYRLARVDELVNAPLTTKPTELALALRYFEAFLSDPLHNSDGDD